MQAVITGKKPYIEQQAVDRCFSTQTVAWSDLYPFAVRTSVNRLLFRNIHTVQTFNSSTSRPGVVVKHIWITCQKYTKHINDPRKLRIKATFSFGVIHASTLRNLTGNRACDRVLCRTARSFSAGIKRRHSICISICIYVRIYTHTVI